MQDKNKYFTLTIECIFLLIENKKKISVVVHMYVVACLFLSPCKIMGLSHAEKQVCLTVRALCTSIIIYVFSATQSKIFSETKWENVL